jgi:hypothetical protein
MPVVKDTYNDIKSPSDVLEFEAGKIYDLCSVPCSHIF